MIPHAALKQVLLILTEELFVVLYTCQVDVEKFVLWLCRLHHPEMRGLFRKFLDSMCTFPLQSCSSCMTGLVSVDWILSLFSICLWCVLLLGKDSYFIKRKCEFFFYYPTNAQYLMLTLFSSLLHSYMFQCVSVVVRVSLCVLKLLGLLR